MEKEDLKKSDYQEAIHDSEADANKYMSYVNGAASFLSIILWILYLSRVFTISDELFPIVVVLFPVAAVILFIPIFLVKTEVVRKSWYKYFILFSLIGVIMAINVALPKHGILWWPFAILIANHYYNPKMGRFIFGFTIIAMLICIYLGMFFGEYDLNLLGGGVLVDGEVQYYDNFIKRYEMLQDMLANGENRYFKVFLYYYLPRAATLALFFMVSNLLNRRTHKLLNDEIESHDAQEKSKTELEVAKGIQLNTLPDEFVSTKEVEIVSELKAAKEVGGDLYDYIDIDENHVAVLIGDVSGKGVPAAMFMMKTITSFRDFATAGKTPSQILKEVNASIFKGNKSSLFVTCFLAILDKTNGKLVYSNAGHNPPIVGFNGNYHYLKCKPGFLLGIFKDSTVVDEEITLSPGESITLYTDGITEARNSKDEFFGEERFLNTMNRRNYTSTIELHHDIKDDVASFVGDAPQSDDITFLTLKYRGHSYFFKEKEFKAKKENILQMLALINDFGDEYKFPDDFKKKLVIVGDELFSNIINYGYENNGGTIFVRLLFDTDTNEFVLTIIDRAKKFNQLEVESQGIGTDISKQKIGGLGLLIVKTIMDEYAYDYINGKNILVLKKKF